MQCRKALDIVFSISIATSVCLGMVGANNPAIATIQGFQSMAVAQSPMPVTYVTVIDANEIVMQITEGEFKFHGYLKRTNGNTFVGEDEQVRVIYERDRGHIVVINVKTGTEYYNYVYSEANEGAL